jgi:catechol 2,3-dioxygenase-like lactoylglutathione lyase family enzyme
MRLDGVRFVTPDAPAVLIAYRRLLGIPPAAVADGRWRFQLERGAVEVAAEPVDALRAIVTFAAEAGDDLATWPTDAGDHGGLDVLVIAPPDDVPPAHSPVGVTAIDHVVVRTADAERAIAHWRDRLGLRLAFDKTFPERTLRLLFFRSGGLTLEYAQPLDGSAPADDVVYGVSYRVADVEAARQKLVAAGLDVSESRPGMKPGTRVATVRSGTAGVPTLLIAG